MNKLKEHFESLLAKMEESRDPRVRHLIRVIRERQITTWKNLLTSEILEKAVRSDHRLRHCGTQYGAIEVEIRKLRKLCRNQGSLAARAIKPG